VKAKFLAAHCRGLKSFCAESLERRTLLSAPFLIKDINPGTIDSQAAPMGRLGGIEFFSATDGVHGRELWKTDGTAAGTAMVSDIIAGPTDSLGFNAAGGAFNGKFYFGANFISSVNTELFVTDGTTVSGGQLLNHVNGGTPQSFTVAGSNLFFTAPTTSSSGQSVMWAMAATGNAAPWATSPPPLLRSFPTNCCPSAISSTSSPTIRPSRPRANTCTCQTARPAAPPCSRAG